MASPAGAAAARCSAEVTPGRSPVVEARADMAEARAECRGDASNELCRNGRSVCGVKRPESGVPLRLEGCEWWLEGG